MRSFVKVKPVVLRSRSGGGVALSASAAQGLVSAGSGPGMNDGAFSSPARMQFPIPHRSEGASNDVKSGFSPEEWKVVLEGRQAPA